MFGIYCMYLLCHGADAVDTESTSDESSANDTTAKATVDEEQSDDKKEEIAARKVKIFTLA